MNTIVTSKTVLNQLMQYTYETTDMNKEAYDTSWKNIVCI